MNLQDMRWLLKDFAANSLLSQEIYRRFISSSGNFVNVDSDIVVEGYPRSGNTFFAALLMSHSLRPLKMARHRHEIGQLKRAISLDKPIFLLVRNPLNSVASFVIREGVSISFALKYYMEFYGYVERSKESLNVICFSEMIDRPSKLIKLVQARVPNLPLTYYGTGSDMNVRSMIINMELEDSGGSEIRETHVGIPSKKRDYEKEIISNIIERKYKKIYMECRSIYERVYSKRYVL
ncbi:hypothetical protein [Microbulbifer sp. SAOS-129_SWC]|uniref:hypothetical protein n=1 Tax=Microbulbifer sp. SAOS-129_SWC TaxID=3145235 RepID=UPI003217911D